MRAQKNLIPFIKNAYDGPRPVQTNTIAPWPQFRNNDTPDHWRRTRTHTAVMDLAGNILGLGPAPLKKFDVETRKYTDFPMSPIRMALQWTKRNHLGWRIHGQRLPQLVK